MNEFKKNKNFLLHYSLKSLSIFVLLDLLLLALKGIHWDWQFAPRDFSLLILAILFCGLPSSIMHNCAHGNTGNRFINKWTGELCGSFMLYGFKGFALAHMFHHIHPDDPQMDPHPPKGHSFLKFVVSPIKSTLRVVERAYLMNHGDTRSSRRNLEWQKLAFNLGLIARTLFWLLLLGNKYFLLIFLPIYVMNIFVFAHINYVTHQENEKGEATIINLNHSLYYRYVNAVSFGGYFHRSHHLRPKLFNPSRLVLKHE
jgi:fatty acid desaturase